MSTSTRIPTRAPTPPRRLSGAGRQPVWKHGLAVPAVASVATHPSR